MVNIILEIKELSKNYGSIRAIDHISFTIEKGNVYGILGPNGSGKTTTLSIVTGLIRPTEGTYKWFGKIPSPKALKSIGSLVEIPNFYPYLSLAQNLQIVADIKSVSHNDINRVLGETNLLTRKHSRYRTLSLGMKQRLGLASALLGNPEVLVLDEPTNSLDPEGIAEVREVIMREANKEKTIILASHILDEVEKVCSHVAILKKGNIIANGKVHELLEKDDELHITTTQTEKFKEALVRGGFIKTIESNGTELRLTLASGKTPRDVNEFAFKNGVVLEKIEVIKQSLETQFLEIIK